MKKASCIYGILIGVCMIGMWTLLLLTGQVVELHTEPYRIAAHLSSEFITAVLLIISGIAVLSKRKWGVLLHNVSLGALFYSVLTAGGYYLQKGDIAMTIMFACFLAATLIFIMTSIFRAGK